jgi:hypothetical protein
MNARSIHRVSRLRPGALIAAPLVLLLLSSQCAWAARISHDRARSIALRWLALNATPLGARMGSVTGTVTGYGFRDGSQGYYIVRLKPGGFVVVSGDDRYEPVICFSARGSFEAEPGSPLTALLDRDLRVRRPLTRPRRAAWWGGVGTRGISGPVSDERVAPLVQTRWSQDKAGAQACYNYYTPPNSPGDVNNYPSGCVATALAQLIRFHQYPTSGVGTRMFYITVNGVSQPRSLRGGDGWGGPYHYADMPLTPGFGTTTLQRQAIGALCHDAGVAVRTSYDADASSAVLSEADTALISTFSFGSSVFGFNANHNIGPGLIAMINPNLDAGLPVLLGVYSTAEGHALICDGYGYNGSTMYHHLNMGWAGLDDAWYNLPNVDAKSGGYTSVDQCLYNIYTAGSGEIVSGRVTDNLGRPVPDAIVTAQRSGGGTYTSTTNTKGIYALAKLPSNSNYTLTVQKPYYTFTPRKASTGRSIDREAASGNAWAVDFVGQYEPDLIPPTCTITGPPSPTSASPITFTITFSEPVVGFAASSVVITGGTSSAFSGGGANFTIQVTPNGSGEVTCRVPASVTQDAAGNENLASNIASVIYQDPPPAIAITIPTANGSCARNCSTLTLAGTASDNAGIIAVAWSCDRGGSGVCAGTTAWSATVGLAPGTNVITVTATDTASNTTTTDISVDLVSVSPGEAWHGAAMVSLPIIPDRADPAAVVAFNGWYAYDPAVGYIGYADHRSWFEPTSSTPGRGFWAYLPADGVPSPCGTVPAQNQPVTIHLKPGWNLIGQPFTAPVDWNSSAITITTASGTRPLREARDAVANYAWGWNTAAGAYYLVGDPAILPDAVGILQPWQAYWVKAFVECDMKIPAPTVSAYLLCLSQ